MKMKNRNYIIQILTKHAMLNSTFQTAIHKHGRHTPPQSNTRRATPHRGTCHHQNVTVLLGGSPRSRNKPVRLWRWHCLPHRASSARGATVPRRRPLEEKPLITKTGLSWWNVFFCKCVCRWIREKVVRVITNPLRDFHNFGKDGIPTETLFLFFRPLFFVFEDTFSIRKWARK